MNMQILHIIGLSLLVLTVATIVAGIFFVTLGVYLGISNFKGKAMLSRIIHTSMVFLQS